MDINNKAALVSTMVFKEDCMVRSRPCVENVKHRICMTVSFQMYSDSIWTQFVILKTLFGNFDVDTVC